MFICTLIIGYATQIRSWLFQSWQITLSDELVHDRQENSSVCRRPPSRRALHYLAHGCVVLWLLPLLLLKEEEATFGEGRLFPRRRRQERRSQSRVHLRNQKLNSVSALPTYSRKRRARFIFGIKGGFCNRF